MRALVTGAGGFVGRHLLGHLEACGDDAKGTDRSQGGPDLLDSAAIASIVHQAAPDVIYHLAGQADVAASWTDPVETFSSNAAGAVSILAAAASCGVGRVILVSSAEVYGLVPPERMPIDESSPVDPVTPYGASKAAAEIAARQWTNSGLDVVVARPFNHLGPGQSERFVAPALAGRLVRAKASARGEIAIGNTDSRRDFTDVRDVVSAYRMLALAATPGETYNVCSGVDRSIAEIAQLLVARIDPSIDLVPDPDLQRPSDLPVLRGDLTKISEHVGWTPSFDLETTIDDLVTSMTLPNPTT